MHQRRTIDAADLNTLPAADLAEVSRGKTRIVLQQQGRAVAALVSAADLEWLEYLDRQRAEHFKVIQEIQARNADKDPEEVERDIAEVIAEMRAESRAERTAASRT